MLAKSAGMFHSCQCINPSNFKFRAARELKKANKEKRAGKKKKKEHRSRSRKGTEKIVVNGYPQITQSSSYEYTASSIE